MKTQLNYKDISFFIISIFIFAFCTKSNCQINLNQGLILNYKFSNNLKDSSVSNKKANPIFEPFFSTDRHGNPNSCICFDGTDDYLEVDSSKVLDDLSPPYSISFWAKISDWSYAFPGGWAAFISKSGEASTSYRLTIDSSAEYWLGNATYSSIQLPAINCWFNYVMIHTNDYMRVYLNGSLIINDESSSGIYNIEDPLTIGIDKHTYSDYLHGCIDDIRIYNRALSSSEVNLLSSRDWGLSSREIKKCIGDSVLIAGKFRKTAGTYIDTIHIGPGCDSIITTKLLFSESFKFSTSRKICEGDSVIVGDSIYRTSGNYSNIYQTRLGCDSIIRTILEVTKPSKVTQVKFLCKGESFQVSDTSYSTSGTFVRRKVAPHGCDSIFLTTIYIVNPDTVFLDSTKCRGQSSKIGNKIFSNSGLYTELLKNRFGCDSTVNLNLTIIEPKTGFRFIQICKGDTAFDAKRKFTVEGTYETWLKDSLTGCDSLHRSEIKLIRLDLKTTPDTVVEFNSVVVLKAYSPNPDAVFNWEKPGDSIACHNCTQLLFFANQSSKLTVTAIDTNFKCTQQSSFSVNIKCKEPWVNNLITANGDGKNDFLEFIDNSCPRKITSLEVYDRWGKCIHNGHSQNNIQLRDWKPENEGIYFYQFKLEGDETKYHNWVEVLKDNK